MSSAYSLFLAVACSTATPTRAPAIPMPAATPAWYHHVRDSLMVQDAVRDAKAAVARGDCHLLGTTGMMLVVPGIREWRKYQYGIRVFPGMSDAIAIDGQGDYQTEAMVYAGRYNRAVLAAIANGPS